MFHDGNHDNKIQPISDSTHSKNTNNTCTKPLRAAQN